MINDFLNIYRWLVGPEYGFSGEGNEQWYYSLALAINLMLVWWLNPDIALVFTILAIIHYLTIFVYGYLDLCENSVVFATVYFVMHLFLLVIAIFTNYKWAIITAAIPIIAVLLAPNCTGNNIFLRKQNANTKLPLLFNTIIMFAFIVIAFLLPIISLIRITIIFVALLIHPIIDFYQGEGVIISDVTIDVFDNIKTSVQNIKKS